MNLFGGPSEFFSLDIGTTAIRLVQLHGPGPAKTLVKYAYVPVDGKIVESDAKADIQKLGSVIKELVTQAQLTTKHVAVGLPSKKVFTTIVDLERLPADDLNKALKYQADSLIPTPLAESKIDWALIGDSPADPAKVEVLLSSVSNAYVESRLDMLEALGLDVIAFEPDSMAITRALTATDASLPQMIIDIGHNNTDIVMTLRGTPRLVRSLPTGLQSIVQAAAQNLNIDSKQAEQFVFKFGLDKSKLDGQVYEALIGAVDLLNQEIEKSIKFFQARYKADKVDRIIVTGGASSLPEFPLFLANKYGLNVEIGNAWRNVTVAPDRQNELMSLSNHFGVAVGLAERKLA